MAASIVDILLRAKNLASKELNQVTSQLQGLDKAAKFAAGGLSMLAGGFAIQQAVKFAAEMAQLNTQVERSAYAFEHFSGGAAQAAANMRAVQRASGGTLTTLEAQNVAVVGLTQKLASNSQELEKMTRIARGIVSVSPIIHDVETAFSQLGLTIANQSMLRLDQLGTSAVEVRAKMNELKAETKGLTDEQAFSDALMSILENKFNDLTSAAINQASGLEVLRKAWIDYRITAAESFGWFDKLARRMGQELNVETQLRGAQSLIESLPPVISPEQLAVVRDIQKILDEPLDAGDSWVEIGAQLDKLIDKYYDLADARMNFFKGLAVGPQIDFPVDDPMFTTGQDQKRLQTLEDFNKQVEKLIETQARAAQIRVFENTGSVESAAEEYVFATEELNNWVAAQMELIDLPIEDKLAAITNLLPAAASNLLNVADDVDVLREQMWALIETLARAEQSNFVIGGGDALESVKVYQETLSKLRSLVSSGDFNLGGLDDLKTLLNVLPGMLKNSGSAAETAAGGFSILGEALATASANMAGLIAMRAQFGSASTASEYEYFGGGTDPAVDTYEDALAALQRETDAKLEAAREEYAATQAQRELSVKSAKEINSEYEKVKSTIDGIISSAIGPVAGVDANDLLPREDAVNENARRLADIAVNGFKGQDWLGEFALEAPDVFEELKNSSDPKATAAQILKDFQDGLRPDLLDKDRAKELVKRALQGDANTKQLVDEIAGELASELGISLGEAKATASEVLGGGEGATGVSLAPKIDATAAESAASAFASSFNAAISGSTIGADLSGTIMTQVMASVAVIEASGNEAGKALVKGVTATFTDIPAAFIAAVAALVTPAVQASINQNGGRTGAAAV